MKLQLTLVCSLLAAVAIGCDDDSAGDGAPNTVSLGDGGPQTQGSMDAGSTDAGRPVEGVASCRAVNRSVACTGPGGCTGGQVCHADGSFGTCECDATSPAPAACSPEGALAACLGDGACGGLQVCGDDGRFGTCECPAPVTDPDRAATGLEMTPPLAGESVAGLFEVTGTAEGHVAAVYVSIGGGPLLIADGTTQWSLRFDPAALPYGPLTIIARAVGEDGGELQRWIQVYNTDPLVGTWRRTRWNQPWQQSSCVLAFRSSGDLVSSRCGYSAVSGYNLWQRLHDDVIAFQYSYSGYPGYTALATLSHGGERLVLRTGSSYNLSIETFERVDDDEGDGGIDVVDVDDMNDVDSGGYVDDAGF